ncbi:efflux RND transporter periplasmic adaptor subunit [Alkalimonas collagenimarina]|uniref:Efflux RND transporter periplasmic adaptor subunit n=1 Tax=Alkalimonas collagenimarina TaxID=400390 RepID=A0ABT9GV75_9GAMM|nr:efflux RND transporter periplasmic adaptor subunit [Alkalimonas collagenimarina]MDP4534610.1 efflux RND transporter periplasmic adaptor subunit [Alkalimonas collagenimarina]
MARSYSGVVLFLLVALLVFAGYLFYQTQQEPNGQRPPSSAVTVKTATANVEPLLRQISALGTGIANDSVQLIASSSEYLTYLNIIEGQSVQQGDIIARLNDVEQRARVAELQSQLEEQKRQLDRLKNLAATQATAQSMLDEQQTRVNSTVAQLESAQSRLDQMTIKAPFGGILGLRRVSQGAYINSGSVITTLDDISTLRIEFSVPERHIAELAIDMPLSIANVAYRNTEFKGRIKAIDPRLDPVTRSVRVHGVIDNNDLRLRPGMLMNVTVTLTNQDALMIAENALVPLQNRQYVYKVGEDDRVTEVQVEIGQRIPGWVEIIDGLEEGDEVIIEGVQKVRDGVLISRVE